MGRHGIILIFDGNQIKDFTPKRGYRKKWSIYGGLRVRKEVSQNFVYEKESKNKDLV